MLQGHKINYVDKKQNLCCMHTRILFQKYPLNIYGEICKIRNINHYLNIENYIFNDEIHLTNYFIRATPPHSTFIVQ